MRARSCSPLAAGGEAKYGTSGLVSIEWPLPPPDAPLPRDNPLYQLLRAAAAGLVIVQRWLERVGGGKPQT